MQNETKTDLPPVYNSIEALSKALPSLKLSPEELMNYLSKVRLTPVLRRLKNFFSVYSLVLLPDGRLVSSHDGHIDVWNVQTGECELTLKKGHSSAAIGALVLLPDGRLVSGSLDNSIHIWDVKNGKCKLVVGASHDRCLVYPLVLLPDGRLASGGADNCIKIWDVKNGTRELTLEGHSNYVFTLAVLPDGRLASGGRDNSIRVWNVKSGKCELGLEGHSHLVHSLTVLPDGRLASGSWDESIKVWNVQTGKCELTFGVGGDNEECTMSLALLPDGRLASGDSDNSIRIWNVKSGKCELTLPDICLREVPLFKAKLVALPDGCLASCDSLGSGIKIWDLEGPRALLKKEVVHDKNVNTGKEIDIKHEQLKGEKVGKDLRVRVLLDLSTMNEKECKAFGECLKETSLSVVVFGKHNESRRLFDKSECLTAFLKPLISSSLSWIDVSEDDSLTLYQCKRLITLFKDSSVLFKLPTQTCYKNDTLATLAKDLEDLPLGYLDLSGCTLDIDTVSLILKKSSQHVSHCVLQHCYLTDNDIATLALVLAECTQLLTLDLDNNYLTFTGAKILFKALRQVEKIETVSLRFNHIEVIDRKRLLIDLELPGKLKTVHLAGNIIISHKRDKQLRSLLQLLLLNSGLKVNDFLQTSFVSITRDKDNSNNRLLILRKSDETTVTITLTHQEIDKYQALKLYNQDLKSDEDVLHYITQMLAKRLLFIDEALLNIKFSSLSSSLEKKNASKRLLDYHPNAPLKSLLNTHSIFCGQRLDKAPSLLFPDETLTLTEGRVYLLGNESEHAMIAYEYLTGYGQRFLKVAHLNAVNKDGTEVSGLDPDESPQIF
jgi:hypothetical protein